MECGILLPPDTRTHAKKNENSSEEGEEKKIAQQQEQEEQVKALKFSPSDSDYHSVRMSQRNSSGSDLAANYVLRENPKKTKRFGVSKEQRVCKECGKGFQSLKALCGHMASHTDKDKVVKKFQDQKKKKKKLVIDGHSDTETSGPRQRIRVPKRIGYRNLDVNYSASSSASGIEQEQQEVAISLMLLSRDSGHKGGLDLELELDLNLNSLADSSDNNSVVLEAKSSSTDMKRIKVDEEKKLKSGVGISVSENSDSGYFRNGPKKIESDVSVAGFLKNGKFRKLEVESGSGLGASNTLGISKDDKSDQLVKRILVDEEEKDHEENNRGSSSKYGLRKRTKNGLYRAEALMGGSCKNEANYSSTSEFCRNVQKRSKYECLTCNKTFQSHRALGGHRAKHSKTNGCCKPIHESGENSMENDNNSTPDREARIIENGAGGIKENFVDRKSGSKKNKGHECPICFRMFKSGQALGGHKRSHFVGVREANSTMVIREEEPPEAEVTVLFDLNLPAPMEEDTNEDVKFMAW